MSGIWDTKADIVNKNDNLRDVVPIIEKTRITNGSTHYVFSKVMFNNPWYIIPDDDLELFKKFIDGGSRAFPSDGHIPCDVVAREARLILNKIVEISEDPKSIHYKEAKDALRNGKFNLVRGTLKLYLNKYTSRDWRRKRFTDDIDFWIFKVYMLFHVLKLLNYRKNTTTKEWEKSVQWVNPFTKRIRNQVLIAANDLDQLLDFGAGSYLEGTSLKNIFNKKIKRGHDVDLSDIMNIAMVEGRDGIYREDKNREQEWLNSWTAFEEAANTRSSRITSNLISLCRFSKGIADYLERVHLAIAKYNHLFFDRTQYPDNQMKRICRISNHWLNFLKENGPEATREMIHDFYLRQAEEKVKHVQNLRSFVKKLLDLVNSKYKYLKVIFEIEN